MWFINFCIINFFFISVCVSVCLMCARFTRMAVYFFFFLMFTWYYLQFYGFEFFFLGFWKLVIPLLISKIRKNVKKPYLLEIKLCTKKVYCIFFSISLINGDKHKKTELFSKIHKCASGATRLIFYLFIFFVRVKNQLELRDLCAFSIWFNYIRALP